MTADRDLEPTRYHRWLVAHESWVKPAIIVFVLVSVGASVAMIRVDGGWPGWLSALGFVSVGCSIWLSIGANRRHIEQYDRRHPAPSGDDPGQ